MKNFSNIGNKLDITTKEYVDSKSPTALGGGAIIPGAEGVFAQITLDQIYANVFSNKKALRQVFNRVESGQMLVIGMASDGSSGVFIQHITGTIENEVTSSTSTPYESGNRGVYHFIIAEKTTSEGISERVVIWAEKSGTAYSEYHSASQGATEVFSTTVSEGWNTEYVNTETGLCNFSTLVGDGQIYWQLIQTALLRNDLGGTPQGNYFFAGSRFSIEYQSQLMQTTVLDRALGGDEDDGYFIDSISLNPNFLRSWVKYQTETAIGATITFNTKLKISTIGACLYNLFNDQLRSNSIVRELSESSIQFKIIPIVSSSADGNGDWTLCAMQLTINSITQYEIGEMSYPLTTTNPLDNFESVFDGTAWSNLSDTGVWTTNAGDRVAKYINFGALSLLHQYMMFGQYNIIKLSLKDMLEAQGRYALSVENDLLDRVSGLATVATSGSYNDLSDKPSIPSAVTESTVSGWGFTKNTGTITGIKMNGASKGTSGVVDLGTVLTDASVFATSTQGTKADNAMPKKGGTFTGEVKFGSTENFQGYYIKRMIGSLGAGTRYADLDSKYKDGTYHRMWRLRFPSGSSSNFWGKIKITLYGGYSSFNASGVMSKSITCNFNTSNIYNNVGCYDGLGVNVEQDFRISEAIWNATVSAWEVLIWQKNLNGNNSPTIMLECWTTNNTNYINTFNGITAQPVELTQSTSYSAQRASSTGGTKTVEWATLPVYENPLGEEIATVAMLEDKQDKITSSNKLSSSLVDGLGAAAAKSVDTTISANSTSTNLPTSKAVEDRINAHSGIDKVGTITGITMNGENKGTSDVVDLGTVLTDESKFATSAQGTKADNAMPKAGGAFTGAITVQAPTVEMNPATKQYVDTAINAVKQFEYQVVTELPTAAQATMGKIYLVAHSHNPSDGKPDSYDEFITVKSGSTYKWERIGNTDIDLSGYVPTTRKINNKALSSDITLYPTDVGVTEADFPGLNKTGTVTGVKMNGATKTPSSGVVDLGTVLTDDGGTIKKSKTIKMDASANSDGANLKWGTVNHKNPYIGYASDQVDGTFVVGSLLGTNYASGLAIGGGSGNLLWKGAKVATTSDIPNIVQSTGTSTSSVMSQNATTNAISGKLDKTTYEVNKTINFGQDGALYIGKFNVYDTNVTCEVTSTTDVTYSGKLVIATQNYVISEMTVYGDAANTVAPNFYIKPSTTSDPYIEVYFKPSSWSKNVVHIYGSNIQAEPTDVCTNVPSVPSTATSKPTNALNSKANLDGANEFTDGTNTFRDIDGTTQISGSQVILKAIGVMGSASLSVQTDNNNEVFGVESDSENGVIHLNKTISLNGDMGTAGQVLTSQGASAAPQWKSMPTYSLSGTTLTITLP